MSRSRSFGDRKGPARQLKPKHELRMAYGNPYCWACSAQLGEKIFPCRNERSAMTPQQQADFYRRYRHCGRCGHPAGTHRPLCKCREGQCGCWTLHNTTEDIPGQLDLFGPQEAPQGLRKGKDYLNPG